MCNSVCTTAFSAYVALVLHGELHLLSFIIELFHLYALGSLGMTMEFLKNLKYIESSTPYYVKIIVNVKFFHRFIRFNSQFIAL